MLDEAPVQPDRADRSPMAVTATPYLSVVMPVHDGEDWIGATLESLAAEPTEGIEIVVIDSSEGPATAAMIDEYSDRLPVRIIERRDLDRWQTKTNFGVEQARAAHVCMLHQDDVWLPGRIAAVQRWIAKAPDAALHLAPTMIIDRRGRALGRWSCPLPAERMLETTLVMERLLVQNFISVLAPVFRKDAWLAAGGVDTDLWYTADWDLWLKLAGTGAVMYHREVTTGFRVHGSSLTVTGSRNPEDFRSQMRTVLERHLDQLPSAMRGRVEAAARASIGVNVSLATAAGGDWKAVAAAASQVLALRPSGIVRLLRDSRLVERILPRLRAKLSGAF
ncbi:glycosyl transferase family 2 [Sphingomonas sp. F9_3S_D5_B_2]